MKINIKVNKIVYSDASETGYGGYIVHAFDKIIAKGQFNPEEKGNSSTYRELLAVKHILESLKSPLENNASNGSQTTPTWHELSILVLHEPVYKHLL